jgi:hypothetical protein
MSEPEMVERVAMAIARSRHGASLRWEQETGGLRQSALDDARAAIAAMREPTEAMMKAAGADQNYADGGGLERHDFEEEYWRAIAEALK